MNNRLYCVIETKKRELDSRIYFAIKASSSNWSVAIGKNSALFNNSNLFKKGIYTPSNYRYKNLDEYFAETMSDEFDKFMVNYDNLAPVGTFKRLTQEVVIFMKDLYSFILLACIKTP